MDSATDDLAVAISFLARDEVVARELHYLLSGLNVFFFPGKQEDLAGTDGLESMRQPFIDARLVVVLYRSPWGETNWTRVEQTAITDRCFNRGWRGLLFVQLDDTSPLPAWLPETHVRFALEQYGIEQLAGAVKSRVQDLGGHIEPPSALAKARIVQRDAALLSDVQRFFHDADWITSNIHPQIEAVLERTAQLAQEINRELGTSIIGIADRKHCILRDGRVSMNIGWRQGITNSVTEDAGLIAAQFNGLLFMPTEGMTTFIAPKRVGHTTYKPVLSLAREVRWQADDRTRQLLSPEDLAQDLVSRFHDLLGRADRGEVQFGFM